MHKAEAIVNCCEYRQRDGEPVMSNKTIETGFHILLSFQIKLRYLNDNQDRSLNYLFKLRGLDNIIVFYCSDL